MKYYKITFELLELLYLGACESPESQLIITLQTQGVAKDKNNNSPITNASIQFIVYIWRSRNDRY